MRGMAVGLCLLAGMAAAQEAPPERPDLLTFAQGAVPVMVSGPAGPQGPGWEQAVRAIDGATTVYSVAGKGDGGTVVEFVYELPAPTVFDGFAVPNIRETPSPSATFFASIELSGSAEGPETAFQPLSRSELSAHSTRDQITLLPAPPPVPVRWLRLTLTGGLDLPRGTGALEFSEVIGTGRQDAAPLREGFAGKWKQGANEMILAQDGPVVTGCYDRTGVLTGTVTGTILRATGTDSASGTPSAFILSLDPDGGLRGVRSANNGPFRLYAAPAATAPLRADCGTPEPALGCGSVIHGIGFDYDSAVLRPEAGAVLAALSEGLAAEPAAAIVIEGHTSAEGSDAYNQALSERRAQAVVAALVTSGIAATRLSALGVGEARPIASNDDENGRAMNRRVEVICR